MHIKQNKSTRFSPGTYKLLIYGFFERFTLPEMCVLKSIPNMLSECSSTSTYHSSPYCVVDMSCHTSHYSSLQDSYLNKNVDNIPPPSKINCSTYSYCESYSAARSLPSQQQLDFSMSSVQSMWCLQQKILISGFDQILNNDNNLFQKSLRSNTWQRDMPLPALCFSGNLKFLVGAISS